MAQGDVSSSLVAIHAGELFGGDSTGFKISRKSHGDEDPPKSGRQDRLTGATS